jgi:AdoMet-dependent heme synthase
LQPLTPEEGDKLLASIYRTSRVALFTVATAEALSYRRVALDKKRAEGMTGGQQRGPALIAARDSRRVRHPVCLPHRRYPHAEFLPLVARNVRSDRIAGDLSTAPVFRAPHDPPSSRGGCGYLCAYQALCGGSCARALGATGNLLAEDPFCSYDAHCDWKATVIPSVKHGPDQSEWRDAQADSSPALPPL